MQYINCYICTCLALFFILAFIRLPEYHILQLQPSFFILPGLIAQRRHIDRMRRAVLFESDSLHAGHPRYGFYPYPDEIPFAVLIIARRTRHSSPQQDTIQTNPFHNVISLKNNPCACTPTPTPSAPAGTCFSIARPAPPGAGECGIPVSAPSCGGWHGCVGGKCHTLRARGPTEVPGRYPAPHGPSPAPVRDR